MGLCLAITISAILFAFHYWNFAGSRGGILYLFTFEDVYHRQMDCLHLIKVAGAYFTGVSVVLLLGKALWVFW